MKVRGRIGEAVQPPPRVRVIGRVLRRKNRTGRDQGVQRNRVSLEDRR